MIRLHMDPERHVPLWHCIDAVREREYPLGYGFIAKHITYSPDRVADNAVQRVCIMSMHSDGVCFVAYCLGNRFHKAHLDYLQSLANQYGCDGYPEDLIEFCNISLQQTKCDSLYLDDTGLFWFYAEGSSDPIGDCAGSCFGTVYHFPFYDEMICSDCYNQHCYCSNDCCDKITQDTYCEACQEQIDRSYHAEDADEEPENGPIHTLFNYTYKPYPVFFGTESKFKGLFFGHEIELTSRNSSLVGRMPSETYCKRDGSLSHAEGLEVVTHPMTYEHSLGVLRDISNAAKACKSKAFTASCSCGHHIHTPTSAWSDYAIHRLMQSMGLPEWQSIMLFVSQREKDQLCQWANFTQLSKSAAARIAKYKTGTRDLGRYTAINVGSTTIEFRLFRSNVLAERLIKNMQFVLTMHHISHSLLPYSQESMLDVCKQHGYLELLAFCKHRARSLEAIRKGIPFVESLTNDI